MWVGINKENVKMLLFLALRKKAPDPCPHRRSFTNNSALDKTSEQLAADDVGGLLGVVDLCLSEFYGTKCCPTVQASDRTHLQSWLVFLSFCFGLKKKIENLSLKNSSPHLSLAPPLSPPFLSVLGRQHEPWMSVWDVPIFLNQTKKCLSPSLPQSLPLFLQPLRLLLISLS